MLRHWDDFVEHYGGTEEALKAVLSGYNSLEETRHDIADKNTRYTVAGFEITPSVLVSAVAAARTRPDLSPIPEKEDAV